MATIQKISKNDSENPLAKFLPAHLLAIMIVIALAVAVDSCQERQMGWVGNADVSILENAPSQDAAE